MCVHRRARTSAGTLIESSSVEREACRDNSYFLLNQLKGYEVSFICLIKVVDTTRVIAVGKSFSLTKIPHTYKPSLHPAEKYEMVELPLNFRASRVGTYTAEIVEAQLLTSPLIVGDIKQNNLVHFCLPTFLMPHD